MTYKSDPKRRIGVPDMAPKTIQILTHAQQTPGWIDIPGGKEAPIDLKGYLRTLAFNGYIQLNQKHQYRATDTDGNPMHPTPAQPTTPVHKSKVVKRA